MGPAAIPTLRWFTPPECEDVYSKPQTHQHCVKGGVTYYSLCRERPGMLVSCQPWCRVLASRAENGSYPDDKGCHRSQQAVSEESGEGRPILLTLLMD